MKTFNIPYKKAILQFLLIVLPFILNAQDDRIKIIEGEGQAEFPDYKSRQQVEKEAEEMAIINALENEYGRVIIQGNSTYIKNLRTGEMVETTTSFNSIANTYVKGEVIEVTDRKFTVVPGIKIIDGRKTEYQELKCTIQLKARALTDAPIAFEAIPLNCYHVKCKTTSFSNNDQLYLYFKSPSTGFLTVFLDDGKKCQRLLPYLGMTNKFEDGVPIAADQEYLLFSGEKDKKYFDYQGSTDEYIMVAEHVQDQNRLFVVFSTTPIPKPSLKEGIGSEELTENEKRGGWRVPKSLSSEDFQGWLIKNRIHNRNIGVKIIDVTITR